MFYNVLKVKDIVDSKHEGADKKLLMENENSCLYVIGLKKDEIIDTHTSVCNAAVYVVDGEIELHFDAEKFTVKEEEILMFKKDAQHKVLAKKDSKFLLIKI